MKAGVLFARDDIRYVDWEEPAVGAGEVKIRVRACGICGSDVPRVLGDEAHFYPVILGHEFAGVISEVGPGVTSVVPGDHVAGIPLLPCMECEHCKQGFYAQCGQYSFAGSRQNGAFADYVVLPERNVLKIDPSIPFVAAATFEPSTVALHGLRCAGYTAGRRVAVLGIGAIGAYAVQWAKILGASHVCAFDLDESRLAVARELGADETFNFSDAAVLPAGFDYVFETAGQPDAIQSCFQLAGVRSTICCIGTPHRDFVFPWKTWELMNRKECFVTGSWMSYSAPFPGEEWHMTAEHLADGSLRFVEDMIHARIPLSQIREAFERFKTPGSIKGRVILVNDADERD